MLKVFDHNTAKRLSPLGIIGNLNQYGAITTVESQTSSVEVQVVSVVPELQAANNATQANRTNNFFILFF